MTGKASLTRRGALLAGLSAATVGCAKGPNGAWDFTHLSVVPLTGVPYGDHPSQRLDVYPAVRTAGAPALPAVMFYHGGFWQFGARDEAPVQTIGTHLAARGITTIAVGYRLYPETDAVGILEDASTACAWAMRNAHRYGARPGQVVTSGHSAGAWMSAMLHTRPELLRAALGASEDGPALLRGMVGVAGPYANWPSRLPIFGELFGRVPREERFPNTFARRGLPPALLVQGALDWIVLPWNASNFAAALRDAGNEADLQMYWLRDHITVMPALGLLPGSTRLIDDIEGFVTGPALRAA